ncbi:hypothetical protein QTP86_033258, partial [Hemibagrus guttatus]
MHVFRPGEETGVPRGNPRGMGRTCKLHTHMAEAGIEPPTLEKHWVQSGNTPWMRLGLTDKLPEISVWLRRADGLRVTDLEE